MPVNEVRIVEDIDDLGTDFNSNWEFKDGDLVLISDEDNLVQSILNRLNNNLNSLGLYYMDYGSVLSGFIGWKHDKDTLDFMKLEISNCLDAEPRILNYDIELQYNSVGEINTYLTLYYDEDSEFNLNLVISEDGGVDIANN